MRIGHVTPLIAKRYLNIATRMRAVYLKGKSGIGKSQCVWQAGELLAASIDNWQGIIDLRLSQMDQTDFRGVPSVADGRTVWNVPAFFPQPGTAGILFLDEITSAPPSVQAAAYQLILDRAVGDYKLPDGWMIVAAGNLLSDRGVTFQMAAPLLNRMCELEVATTFEDWEKYAMISGIRPEVVTFVKDRSDLLHKFEGKGAIEPFPTPRAWFAVSADMDLELPPQARVEVFKGEVGHEAAVAFDTHLRYWETLPRIADILEGKNTKVPDDINARYCVAMGLSAAMNAENFGNAWAYLSKMPKDMQTMSVKLAYKRDKKITQSPDFIKWATENQEAFKRG